MRLQEEDTSRNNRQVPVSLATMQCSARALQWPGTAGSGATIAPCMVWRPAQPIHSQRSWQSLRRVARRYTLLDDLAWSLAPILGFGPEVSLPFSAIEPAAPGDRLRAQHFNISRRPTCLLRCNHFSLLHLIDAASTTPPLPCGFIRQGRRQSCHAAKSPDYPSCCTSTQIGRPAALSCAPPTFLYLRYETTRVTRAYRSNQADGSRHQGATG